MRESKVLHVGHPTATRVGLQVGETKLEHKVEIGSERFTSFNYPFCHKRNHNIFRVNQVEAAFFLRLAASEPIYSILASLGVTRLHEVEQLSTNLSYASINVAPNREKEPQS